MTRHDHRSPGTLGDRCTDRSEQGTADAATTVAPEHDELRPLALPQELAYRIPEPHQVVNPDGGMFFCENSEVVGNVRDTDPGEIYFSAESQAHRDHIKNDECPTCLSPCQMNVAAIKQVVPYAKFLARASREKRKHQRVTAAAQSAT